MSWLRPPALALEIFGFLGVALLARLLVRSVLREQRRDVVVGRSLRRLRDKVPKLTLCSLQGSCVDSLPLHHDFPEKLELLATAARCEPGESVSCTVQDIRQVRETGELLLIVLTSGKLGGSRHAVPLLRRTGSSRASPRASPRDATSGTAPTASTASTAMLRRLVARHPECKLKLTSHPGVLVPTLLLQLPQNVSDACRDLVEAGGAAWHPHTERGTTFPLLF